MRQLSKRALRRAATRAAQRGLTLIELVVAFSIVALLTVTAAPYFADYGINSRLRESGNTAYAEALFAQSEAIKRNRTVRLATSGSTVQVLDMTDPANPTVLRTRTLADGVRVATGNVDFSSQGWPGNLTAVAINLSHATATGSGPVAGYTYTINNTGARATTAHPRGGNATCWTLKGTVCDS